MSEAFIAAAEARGATLEVKIRGTAEPSPIAGARCPYWEWTAGQKNAGKWVEINARAGSEGAIEVEVDGVRGKFPISLLRLHLHPVYEKRIEDEASLPKPVAAKGVAASKLPITIAEFCLRSGETYHAKIERVSQPLPPRGPGQPPGSSEKVLLHLSDQPFKDGKTDTPLTPRTLGGGF